MQHHAPSRTFFPCRLLFLQPSKKPSKRLVVRTMIHAVVDFANVNYVRLHAPEGCGFEGVQAMVGPNSPIAQCVGT